MGNHSPDSCCADHSCGTTPIAPLPQDPPADNHGSGPHGSGPHGSGPHGSGPHGSGPHGSGPHGSGPHGSGPHGSGPHGSGPHGSGHTRRDFIYLTAGALGAVGVGAVLWPILQNLSPAADTLAMSTTEVNLAPVQVGQAITVMWRGKPVFIRRRTADEIAKAAQDDTAQMRDQEADAKRVKKPEWLILVGICTHLGCVPLGQKATDNRGEFGGWFCPCHGSEYDTSGRIRKGPAPKNLEVPTYVFTSDTTVRIG